MPYTLTPPSDAAAAVPSTGYLLTPPDSLDVGAQPPAVTRSYADELARQAKLALRYGVEGVGSVAGIFANPVTAAYNLATGSNAKLPTQALSDLLTTAGLPQPESGAERVSGDVSRGIAGAGGMVGSAKMVGDLIGPMAEAVRGALASAPGLQATSAAASGAAGGVTREAGGGQIAQILASLGGGFMPAGLEALATNRQVPATLPADQAARQQAMQAVGVTNPPRAAITRDPNEWYRTQELGKVEGANKTALAQSSDQVNAQLGAVLPGMRAGAESTPVEQGEMMRQAVKAYQADAKNVASGTYDAVPMAPGGESPFPAQAFLEKAAPILQDFEDFLPGAVTKRIKEFENAQNPAAPAQRPVSGVDPSKDDVITAIRKFGGINPGDEAVGSLAKANPFPPDPRYGPVWRGPQTATSSSNKLVAGHSLDDMAAKLKQAGYIAEAEPDAVMDKIADSTMQGPQYSAYFEHQAQDPLAAAISQLTEQMAVKNAPAQGARRDFTVGEAAKLYQLINDTTGSAAGPAKAAGGALKAALADAAGGLTGEPGTAMQLFKDATQQWRTLKTTLAPQPIAQLAKADEASPNFANTLIGSATSKPGDVAALMKLLQENNPAAAQSLHDSALDYLQQRSTRAGPDSSRIFSGKMLATEMDKPGMMERLQAVLSPQEMQQIDSLRTASEALTSEPNMAGVNRSNSGSTLGNLARHMPWTAMAAGAGEMIGHHFELPPVVGMLAGGGFERAMHTLMTRSQTSQLADLLNPEFLRARTLGELGSQTLSNVPAAGLGTIAGMPR